MADAMDEEEGRSPRAFWSGVITFGLVSIPVDLYSGTRPRDVALRLVDAEGQPVHRRYVCEAEGDRPLAGTELARGAPRDDGNFVVVSDEELEALEPKKSREIDLVRFVDASALDPMYCERSYFLLPAGDTNKAYRLLAATMERAQKVGIATFVMRGKEKLVAIHAAGGILRAETLRFHDELRRLDDLELPLQEAKRSDVERFERAIRERREPALAVQELTDPRAGALHNLVQEKLKKHRDVVAISGAAAAEERGEVTDVMEVLLRRLGVPARGAAGAVKPARRAGRPPRRAHGAAPPRRARGGRAHRAHR